MPTRGRKSFSSTQAAWRFYKNENASLSKLEAAYKGVIERCQQYALCIHDWCRINYRKHTRKEDRYQITHKTDVGYDLQSSLLVDDQKGQPIAPIAQRLVTGKGSYATYQTEKSKKSLG